jgi:hypothetical protein
MKSNSGSAVKEFWADALTTAEQRVLLLIYITYFFTHHV